MVQFIWMGTKPKIWFTWMDCNVGLMSLAGRQMIWAIWIGEEDKGKQKKFSPMFGVSMALKFDTTCFMHKWESVHLDNCSYFLVISGLYRNWLQLTSKHLWQVNRSLWVNRVSRILITGPKFLHYLIIWGNWFSLQGCKHHLRCLE